MGQTLLQAVLTEPDLTLVGALEVAASPILGRDAGESSGHRTGVAISADVPAAVSGADVLIDSKFKGILIGEKSFQVTSGSHKVTLSREGVNPYTAEVTVSEGEKKMLNPPAPTTAQEGSS